MTAFAKKSLVLITMALLVFLTACGGGSSSNNGGNTPTLQSITVGSSKTTVALGTTQQLSATGHYSDGSTKDLTSSVAWAPTNYFTSSTPGLFKAAGTSGATVMVSASFSGLSGSFALTLAPPNLVSIAVTPANPTIAMGLKQQFQAIGTYTDNSTQNVTATATWSSANTSVATIAAGGLASSVAQGTTVVTATSGSVNGTTGLTVGPATLVSIAITPAAKTLFAGQTQQFTATGSYTDQSTKDLTGSATWNSSNTAAATIASGGLASAVAAGATSITASFGGITSSAAALTVDPPAVVSIAVTPVTARTAVSFTQQFTATATMTDGSSQNITSTSTTTWKSSDTSKATISNSAGTQGLATGVAAGTTNITAVSSNGVNGNVTSDVAVLTVTPAKLVSIAVTPADSTIFLGTLQQMTATGTFNDGTKQDITNRVTWSSSVNTIASITVSGVVSGQKIGAVTISAVSLDGKITGSTSLTVSAANLVSIAVQPSMPQIAFGTSLPFKAVGTFANGSQFDITSQATWSSGNTAAATISSGGLAKGIAAGSSVISAALNSITGTTTLTVSAATISSITLNPASPTLAVNTRVGVTATGIFSDGTSQNIGRDATWTSKNTAVATVVGSTVTAISPGMAEIDATFETATGVSNVTVTGATLNSISVAPATALISPASTKQYSAVGTFSDQSTQNISSLVTWDTSNHSVATITTSGLATGQSAGQVNISATLGSVSNSSAQLIVEGAVLNQIVVTPKPPFSGALPQGYAASFTATGIFADGKQQDLTNFVIWTSTDPTVATVSNIAGSQGQASGLSVGTATITAVFGGVAGQSTLTVTSAILNSLSVTPTTASVKVGSTQGFRALGAFSDGTSLDLSTQAAWKSDPNSIAIIGTTGAATGISAGTANISATLNGVSSNTALLTVTP